MVNQASPLKKRKRRTQAEMDVLRNGIYELAKNNQVCTVRQIYYLGIGIYWDKDTGGKRAVYNTVVRIVGELREADILPWDWIADNTRWVRRPRMYLSAEDAVDQWVDQYRRDLWAYQPINVEVWCESDSIAGVIQPVTMRYGIGLYVCRGQAGKGFVRDTAMYYAEDDRPVHILYAGDWDPSGLSIQNAVNERMHRYGGKGLNINFNRVGVTASDVRSGRYTSHASNRADSNYRRFEATCKAEGLDPDVAVEVEAIPPQQLRSRLQNAIEPMVDGQEWAAAKAAEQSERQHLATMRTLMGDMQL